MFEATVEGGVSAAVADTDVGEAGADIDADTVSTETLVEITFVLADESEVCDTPLLSEAVVEAVSTVTEVVIVLNVDKALSIDATGALAVPDMLISCEVCAS